MRFDKNQIKSVFDKKYACSIKNSRVVEKIVVFEKK